MKKLMTCVLCVLALAGAAFAQDPGVVFKADRAVPVLATTLWADEEISLFGVYPSVDALLGYNQRDEHLTVGYQIVGNYRLTERTSAFVGVAYLANIGEVRFDEVWDKLGLSVGFRLKF